VVTLKELTVNPEISGRQHNHSDELRVSVIIALVRTHLHCLKDCISSLTTQTLPRSEYEVILVNAEGDSTIDSTVSAIAENMPKDFNFHYFRIQKGGRAAAVITA